MHIPDFHYHRPGTLDEALHLLDTKPDGVLLAGGTDLLVDLKQRDSLVHKSIRSRREQLDHKAPQRCNTLWGFHLAQWAVRDSNL
ncbi:MAG: FAD binding domain-containing protein [Acidimicrobiia bacterium]